MVAKFKVPKITFGPNLRALMDRTAKKAANAVATVRPEDSNLPAQQQTKSLRYASVPDIRKHLQQIYRTTIPAPNLYKAEKTLNDVLKPLGFRASRQRVRDILAESEFADLRLKAGRPRK